MPENATSIATSPASGERGAISRILRVCAAPYFSITMSWCMLIILIELSKREGRAQDRERVGVDRADQLLAFPLGADEARVGELLDVMGDRRGPDVSQSAEELREEAVVD